MIANSNEHNKYKAEEIVNDFFLHPSGVEKRIMDYVLLGWSKILMTLALYYVCKPINS